MDFRKTQSPSLARWIYENLSNHKLILDIGCGTKWYHQFLNNNIITSIDIWEPNKPSIVLDISKNTLPFPDEYFDAVIMLDIIEHLDKYPGRKALTEAQRVCNNQLLLLTPLIWDDNSKTPDKDNPYQRHRSLWSVKDFNESEGWSRISNVMDVKYYLGIWIKK